MEAVMHSGMGYVAMILMAYNFYLIHKMLEGRQE